MRAVLLGSLLLAALPHAQMNTTFSGGAGLFVPLGEGAEMVTNGPRFGARIGFQANEVFEMGLEIAYNKYAIDEDEFREEIGIADDIDFDSYFRILELSAVPTFYLVKNEKVGVYGLVGAGMHLFKGEIKVSDGFQTETSEDSEEKFGIQFGGGMEFSAGERLKIGMTPRYHIVFTEDENTKYFTVLAYLKI